MRTVHRPYGYDDLLNAYRQLGVEGRRCVYVTSDVGRLMAFEKPGKHAVLEAHFRAIMELIGSEGTVVVPAATMNLCNTEIPFDPERTPSYNIGTLSEYVRIKPGSRRNFHPFVSYAALGAEASVITESVSRCCYGVASPMAHMIEMDALSVSIGLYPRYTCSTAHHVEQVVTVPYRYLKEFMHPVARDGAVRVEPFYMYCLYRDSDVERNFLKWIFPRFAEAHELRQVKIGRGEAYSYSMREFFDAACSMFLANPYVWCERPPEVRPWRK